MITQAEKDFLTPAPIINEAAFDRMCSILNLTEDERQLARFVICSYETAKDPNGKTLSHHYSLTTLNDFVPVGLPPINH